MWPYTLMLIIIVVCFIGEYNHSAPKTKNKYFILALIPVFILISFKSREIGADTERYLNAYDEMSSLSSVDSYHDTRVEIGFRYLMFILSRYFQWSQTLLITTGVIVCTSLYFFIKRTATNYSLLLFFFVTLGFFQFAMSGIRQIIAVSIILWSFPYIFKRNFIKFGLVVAVAYLFHKSSIIFLLAYFIADIKLTKTKLFLIFAALIAIILSMESILLSAAELLEYNYGVEKTDNGYVFFAIVLIITLLVLATRESLINHNPTNKIAVNINIISFALWCARLISRTVERISLYFMPYTYLALEEYLMTRRENFRSFYISVAIICSFALFMIRISGQPTLCEYTFCF